MKFVEGNPDSAARMLAERMVAELGAGKKVFWLVPGGSNISIAVAVQKLIKSAYPAVSSANLFVTLTDERYGPVGHADSNWKQLGDAGFDFNSVQGVPVLSGLDQDETVNAFERTFESLSAEADVVIGHFGVGADSHIAGVLPNSPAIDSKRGAVAYDAPNFKRITLTLSALGRIDVAYAFIFGESKKQALENLHMTDAPVTEQPAQFLKKLKEVYIVFGL